MPKVSSKPTPAERELLDQTNPMVLTPGRAKELKSWIGESLPGLITHRQTGAKRRIKWQATLRGVSLTPAIRRGASQLVTPMTIASAAGMRARVEESIYGSSPHVVAEPFTQKSSEPSAEASIVAQQLAKFIEAQMRSPKGWNAFEVGRMRVAESVNFGTAGFKVVREPTHFKALPPLPGDTRPRRVPVPSRIRWEHIAFEDLVYWTGYGTDLERMPYVGHVTRRTWASISQWAEEGYYRKDAIDKIKAHYANTDRLRENTEKKPAHLREHEVLEMYVDFPVNESSAPVALLVDYHVEAMEFLRVTWNPSTSGTRPIFVDQFDRNPQPLCLEGQGVCEKLEGPQDEADMIHNLGIESGKRAAAFMSIVRFGSALADQLGGQDPLLPGDMGISEDPANDMKTLPLGDPKAAEIAVILEQRTQQYVSAILGRDDSQSGDIQTGKRVPNQLGMTIAREARVITRHALSNHALNSERAIYLSLEYMRDYFELVELIDILGAEMAEKLAQTVFAPVVTEDQAMDKQFVIRVSAQDAATIQESRKSELMILTQFLFTFYDKLAQYAQLHEQSSPKMQEVLAQVAQKMQNAVQELMTHVESINDPAEVVPEVAALISQVQQGVGGIFGGGGGGGLPGRTNPGGPTSEAAIEAVGGGVT